MSNLRTKGSFFRVYSWLPIIILFISVLNEFDLNYLTCLVSQLIVKEFNNHPLDN